MSKNESRISKLEKDRISRAVTETEIPRDPVAFARLLDIAPDPWQQDLLTSTDERIIINCSRQSGKSTIVAILALHHALLNPGALVAIVSPSQRQSTELLRKASSFYRLLGQARGSVADSATTLELKNGSRIVALPGSEATTRGFAASLVLIDEAAEVSEDDYYAATPMLAVSRGQLILLSTPRGKQGIFWHAWDQEPDWKRVKVTADECPRIGKAYLERERRAMGEWRFAQEYCCEFVQQEASIFKEAWVQLYDPDYVPEMDFIVESWDTALTKSSSSSYAVGQVWGHIGADFYLLDQVRGRFDFDETVRAIEDLSKSWPESAAILMEAQALGAALVTHLKDKIPGLIPIPVKGPKELRALNCVPVWQSKNVYIPKPDNGDYAWVREYLQELLNFPNAANDDQVDATTLALNQMHGKLFPTSKQRVAQMVDSQQQHSPPPHSPPLHGHNYFIGWVPGRPPGSYTVLVFDLEDCKVSHFGRYPVGSLENQLKGVSQLSRHYNRAVVRAFDDGGEALISELEMRGVFVETVKFSKLEASYENLALLMEDVITIPDYPQLQAELDVFKSDPTFDGGADYSAQVAQQSGIHALCLATYDLAGLYPRQPSVYYSFDRDLIGDVHFSR